MSELVTPLRVMQSVGVPRPTTNPYNKMLDEALAQTAGLKHLRFSWKQALLGRYDVFHWHWPEVKLHGTTWWKSTVLFALSLLLYLRHASSRKIAVVRTVHNIELPDDNALRLWLLRRIDAQTHYRIVINETTPLPDNAPYSLILHGHYRDWYGSYPQSTPTSGQLGTFGGIRRYKSMGAFLEAYAEAVKTEPHLTLRGGGRASSPGLAAHLRSRAASLEGVTLHLEFLSDAELVDVVTSSQLTVFAYKFMHNSGAVLAALSLNRPVLVPSNEANKALADEVGSHWVIMYEGELDGAKLIEGWRASTTVAGSPDLSRREWSDAGVAHAEAFRAAAAVKRGTPEVTSHD